MNDRIELFDNYLAEADESYRHKKDTFFHITFAPTTAMFNRGIDPASILDELRAMGDVSIVCNLELVPAFDNLDPVKCFFSWEIDLRTKYDINTIKYIFIFVEDICKIVIDQIEDVDILKREK